MACQPFQPTFVRFDRSPLPTRRDWPRLPADVVLASEAFALSMPWVVYAKDRATWERTLIGWAHCAGSAAAIARRARQSRDWYAPSLGFRP